MPDQPARPARPRMDDAAADLSSLVDLGLAEPPPEPSPEPPPPVAFPLSDPGTPGEPPPEPEA